MFVHRLLSSSSCLCPLDLFGSSIGLFPDLVHLFSDLVSVFSFDDFVVTELEKTGMKDVYLRKELPFSVVRSRFCFAFVVQSIHLACSTVIVFDCLDLIAHGSLWCRI